MKSFKFKMEEEVRKKDLSKSTPRRRTGRSLMTCSLSVLTAFFLTVCAVQPWNIPISFLEENIQLRSLQGGNNGAPMSEEIQEKADNKLEEEQGRAELLFTDPTALLGDPRPLLIHLLFLEVPTPPPRS